MSAPSCTASWGCNAAVDDGRRHMRNLPPGCLRCLPCCGGHVRSGSCAVPVMVRRSVASVRLRPMRGKLHPAHAPPPVAPTACHRGPEWLGNTIARPPPMAQGRLRNVRLTGEAADGKTAEVRARRPHRGELTERADRVVDIYRLG